MQFASVGSQMVLTQLVYGIEDPTVLGWNNELGLLMRPKKKKKEFDYVLILMSINKRNSDITSDSCYKSMYGPSFYSRNLGWVWLRKSI